MLSAFLLCLCANLALTADVLRAINTFNDSIDLEWDYQNFTSFELSIVKLPPPAQVITVKQTNKYTYEGTGNVIITLDGISAEGCQNLTKKELDKRTFKIEASNPPRQAITNYKVNFGEKDGVNAIKLTWDPILNATQYKVTYRKKDDCMPMETTHLTSDTMFIIEFKYSDVVGSLYIFDVGVSETTLNVKPKADQMEVKVPTVTTTQVDLGIKVEERDLNNIKIKWTAMEKKTYTISYKEKASTADPNVIKDHAEASFKVSGLRPRTEYMFTVTLHGYSSSINSYSNNTLLVTTASEIMVKKYRIFSNEVKLSWYAIEGVDKYTVEYKENADGAAQMSKEVTSTNVTINGLSPNTTYSIMVKAKNGTEDFQSEKLEMKTGLNIQDFKLAIRNKDSITISWNPVMGVDSYFVFYSDIMNPLVNKTETTMMTNYTATSLMSGKTYKFAVRTAPDASSSFYSTEEMMIETAMPMKFDIKCNSKTELTLEWDNVQGVETYKVQYHPESNTTMMKTVTKNTAKDNGKSYVTLTNLMSNTSYVVSIMMVDRPLVSMYANLEEKIITTLKPDNEKEDCDSSGLVNLPSFLTLMVVVILGMWLQKL